LILRIRRAMQIMRARYVSLLAKRRPNKTAMRDLLRTVKGSQLRRGTAEATPQGYMLMVSSARVG
jgi:hypothetical protein